MKTIPAANKSSVYLGIAYALVSIFLISYLPTLVPSKPAPGSASYMFGYNNHFGLALILILTAIGVFVFGKSIPQFAVNDFAPVSRKTLWTCLAVACLAGLAMYLLTSRLGSFLDSSYFINRVEMASHGLRPYRDFEFGYGAIFVYGPLILSRLLHLSVPNGYYLFWMLNLLFGTWFLAELVSRIDYPGGRRNAIFVLLFLSTFPTVIIVGLNYTAFRFATAPLLAIITFNVIRDGSLRSQIRGSLLTPVFTILLLAISPEIGVAYAVAILAFMVLFYFPFQRKSVVLPYLGMLLLIGLVLAAANWMHVFDSLKGVANGGLSFPIIPSSTVVAFLLCLFICATLVVRAIAQRTFRTNYICVLLVALPMLSSTFSRCDPGHIFWNGLGFLVIALLWVSGSARMWRYCSPIFLLVFVGVGFLSGLLLSRSDFLRVYLTLTHAKMTDPVGRRLNRSMVQALGSEVADAKISKFRIISQIDGSKDPVVLPPQLHGIAEVPFGYGVSHNTESLDYGYYDALSFVLDPKTVDRKILELQQNPYRVLLLARGYESQCSTDAAGTRAFLSTLFIFPYRGRARHSESLYAPLCDYISSHYKLTVPAQTQTYDYEIWSPK